MRVFIVSPFSGDVYFNKRYLHQCLLDSLYRGESPFAGHGFYTNWLDDEEPTQRYAGMTMGRDWMRAAEIVAVYDDLGISTGMQEDINFAKSFGLVIENRKIPPGSMKILRGD